MSLLVIPNVLVNGTPGDANPVNANFTAISTIVNGSIDQSNLAPGTQFPTSIIAQDAGLQPGHLAPGCITASKIAPGASVRNRVAGNVVPSLNFSTVETTIVTVGPITTSGGRVLFDGMWGLSVSVGFSGLSLTLKLKRNGTPIVTLQYPVGNGGASTVMQMCVPPPAYLDTGLAAGTYTYTVTMITSSALGVVVSPATNPGVFFAEEAA